MTVRSVIPNLAETTLAEQFSSLDRGLRSPERDAAFARFAARGLPTRRVESWHYTDLRAAMGDAAPLAPAPGLAEIATARALLAERPGLGGGRLVLVDGRLIEALCEAPPTGVRVTGGAARAPDIADPLAALNVALSLGGCTVTVDAGVALARPIEIVHVVGAEGPRAVYSTVALVAEKDARASFVESHLGAGARAQRHATAWLTIGAGAKVAHVVAIEDDAGLHVETQACDLSERSELSAFAFVSGGALVRRQLFVKQSGDAAKIDLGGLALIDRRNRADTTLQVVHGAPNGVSREFYRAVVADEGVGIFQGKVIVERGAQKTDGAMKSQAILLSPEAQMNAKPELEIFADDVLCGHGATVAALDPEQIFYLESRGLPRLEAEAMLLEGFGAEAIARVADEAVAQRLRSSLAAWLSRRGAPA
jgi:Fe-S cluster assembly protein SufD